ncbi:MAG: pyridoxal-phosphate dependent enzyme, partial [Trueperaceae bacterium]|nr:pyridoxal-phosphate dependent enzyme [Trueperaceae bacterium]
RLVEATSANTGIALAWIAGRLGLSITLVMPDDATSERVRTMRAYGAELILTPAARTIEHAREVAERLVAEEGYAMLDQFANPDNWRAHEATTGPEIWQATEGRVTHFVSAMGTTGTIMGVSRALKSRDPSVTIVGTQPAAGSSIPGIRRWSPAFVPAIFEPERVDRIVDVTAEAAREQARLLAREAGLLAGMSTGGALTAALEVAADLDEATIVFIACDRGDRYLSGDLFG